MARRPRGRDINPQARLLPVGAAPEKVAFHPHTHPMGEVKGLLTSLTSKANAADVPTAAAIETIAGEAVESTEARLALLEAQHQALVSQLLALGIPLDTDSVGEPTA